VKKVTLEQLRADREKQKQRTFTLQEMQAVFEHTLEHAEYLHKKGWVPASRIISYLRDSFSEIAVTSSIVNWSIVTDNEINQAIKKGNK